MARIFKTVLISAALIASTASVADARRALAANGTSIAGTTAPTPVVILSVELPSD